MNVTGVPTNQADFYGKYLYASTPTKPPAYKGVWDLALRAGARTGSGTRR